MKATMYDQIRFIKEGVYEFICYPLKYRRHKMSLSEHK